MNRPIVLFEDARERTVDRREEDLTARGHADIRNVIEELPEGQACGDFEHEEQREQENAQRAPRHHGAPEPRGDGNAQERERSHEAQERPQRNLDPQNRNAAANEALQRGRALVDEAREGADCDEPADGLLPAPRGVVGEANAAGVKLDSHQAQDARDAPRVPDEDGGVRTLAATKEMIAGMSEAA